MHPVIRIVVFLIAAGFLAAGHPVAIFLSAVVLSLLLLRAPSAARHAAFGMLRRLRWLLLSMLIVYGWFTPGAALWSPLGVASPTTAGLLEGLQRASALLLMALAARQLLAGLGAPQLLAALLWIAKPLQVAGLSADRLALRMMLTLEAVPRLTQLLTADLYAGLSGHVMKRFGAVAARAYACALQQADLQQGRAIEIVRVTRPPWYQWSYPLGLAILLMAMR